MKDRIPRHPGRVELTPVSGQENIYDMIMADDAIEEGTPPIKRHLLPDDVARIFDAQNPPQDVGEALEHARTLISNAQTAADGATTAAGNAQTTAGTAVTAAGNVQTNLNTHVNAANPHSGSEPRINAGTTAQFWRGDKTWQPHNSIVPLLLHRNGDINLNTHPIDGSARFSFASGSLANGPIASGVALLCGFWGSSVVQIFSNGDRMWMRNRTATAAGAWVELATQRLLNQVNFSYRSGFSPGTQRNAGLWLLNDNRTVNFIFSLQLPASLASGAIVADIPAGMRPMSNVSFPITAHNGTASGELFIQTNGTCSVHMVGATSAMILAVSAGSFRR